MPVEGFESSSVIDNASSRFLPMRCRTGSEVFPLQAIQMAFLTQGLIHLMDDSLFSVAKSGV
jgi:hypothetical protein